MNINGTLQETTTHEKNHDHSECFKHQACHCKAQINQEELFDLIQPTSMISSCHVGMPLPLVPKMQSSYSIFSSN